MSTALVIAAPIVSGVSLVVHPSSGVVALEVVADVEVLLEVPAQGEVEERRVCCGELHTRGQPALDDRDIAGGEMARQPVHIPEHLEAFPCGKRCWARTRRSSVARVRARARGRAQMHVPLSRGLLISIGVCRSQKADPGRPAIDHPADPTGRMPRGLTRAIWRNRRHLRGLPSSVGGLDMRSLLVQFGVIPAPQTA
jgi:hypothetical protein